VFSQTSFSQRPEHLEGLENTIYEFELWFIMGATLSEKNIFYFILTR